MTKTFTGGCLCGAVRYEISAEPIMAGRCRCRSCRSLSGAGHSVLAAFPEDAVSVSGQVKGYNWTANSGAAITTEFCPNCGSPLFGRSSGMEGILAVKLGSLNDPNAISPQMEIFTSRALEWDHPAEGLPNFPEMPPME